MELFKHDSKIDFMGKRKITGAISLFACVISILGIAVFGINFGLEFTGGTQIELRFKKAVTLDETKEKLEQNGFIEYKIQYYGSSKDILVRFPWSKDFKGKMR